MAALAGCVPALDPPTPETCSQASAAVGALEAGFVETSGPSLRLGDSRFRFVGANAYYLLDVAVDGHLHQVEALLADARSLGLPVVRTWAFYEGLRLGDGWTWPAEVHGALDDIVAAARRHGLRLVLTLANYWQDYGGVPAYLERFGLDREDDAAFWSDPRAEAAWRAHAASVVERFRDDPTVMAWELMNEPRCRAAGCTPGLAEGWLGRQAAWLEARAPRQLVLTGEEGYWAWDDEGIDFRHTTALPAVAAGSFHLHPDGALPGRTFPEQVAFGREWIAAHATEARSLDKPVVLGEVGWMYRGCPAGERDCGQTAAHTAPNDEQRAEALGVLLDAARRSGVDGALVWMLADAEYPDYDHRSVLAATHDGTAAVLCDRSGLLLPATPSAP